MVESAWQEGTMCEVADDLDFLAHDLASEFGDSSSSEIIDDCVTEPDILVF